MLPKIIMAVEHDCVSKGKSGMDYRLDGRFCIVVLPHKTSLPVRRKQAFASLPERLALAYGDAASAFVEDAGFRSLLSSKT